MEDKENNIYTYTQKIMSQVVSNNDKETIKAITRYCEENNIIPNIISEEKLKEVLKLGIAKKIKIDNLQSQLQFYKDKEDKIRNEINCYYKSEPAGAYSMGRTVDCILQILNEGSDKK